MSEDFKTVAADLYVKYFKIGSTERSGFSLAPVAVSGLDFDFDNPPAPWTTSMILDPETGVGFVQIGIEELAAWEGEIVGGPSFALDKIEFRISMPATRDERLADQYQDWIVAHWHEAFIPWQGPPSLRLRNIPSEWPTECRKGPTAGDFNLDFVDVFVQRQMNRTAVGSQTIAAL